MTEPQGNFIFLMPNLISNKYLSLDFNHPYELWNLS